MVNLERGVGDMIGKTTKWTLNGFTLIGYLCKTWVKSGKHNKNMQLTCIWYNLCACFVCMYNKWGKFGKYLCVWLICFKAIVHTCFHWCFTWNNAVSLQIKHIADLFSCGIEYCKHLPVCFYVSCLLMPICYECRPFYVSWEFYRDISLYNGL